MENALYYIILVYNPYLLLGLHQVDIKVFELIYSLCIHLTLLVTH